MATTTARVSTSSFKFPQPKSHNNNMTDNKTRKNLKIKTRIKLPSVSHSDLTDAG